MKQDWMTTAHGLAACFAPEAFQVIRGRGVRQDRTSALLSQPEVIRPRGVMTPAPAVDHAPSQTMAMFYSDSEQSYRGFPIRRQISSICVNFVILAGTGDG